MSNKKIGLVLSGGASKCIAQLGVLDFWQKEIGFRPDAISAVSGSAILGSLYAAGLQPSEILKFIIKEANFSFYFPSFRKGGFFTMSRIVDAYRKVQPAKSFEELQIPLIICATNITQGTTEYFSSGELLTPIIASSSYPVVFEPIEIKNHWYLDGGITNNFPVEPLIATCKAVVGISVGKIYPIEKGFSVQRTIFRSLELAINEHDKIKHPLCDFFLDLENLNDIPMFDFSTAERTYQIGYQQAEEKAVEFEKFLKKYT